MSELFKFLQVHEMQFVWFLIPAGLVAGMLEKLTQAEPVTVHLSETVYLASHINTDLADTYLLVSQIAGWGDKLPVFHDIEG